MVTMAGTAVGDSVITMAAVATASVVDADRVGKASSETDSVKSETADQRLQTCVAVIDLFLKRRRCHAVASLSDAALQALS